MSKHALPDGQEIRVDDRVTLGCSCHPGAHGRITGFRNGLAEIELDDGADVCLPVHMLDLCTDEAQRTPEPAWDCAGCGQWGVGVHVCPTPKQKRVARGRKKREPEASNGKPDLAGHRDSSNALPVADLHTNPA